MEKFLINYHSENICLHCLIKQYMRTALPYYIDADVLDAKSQFTMNYRSQDECFINQICFFVGIYAELGIEWVLESVFLMVSISLTVQFVWLK